MTKTAGCLLSEPMASTEGCEVKFWRSDDSSYENLSNSFVLPTGGRNYQLQYFHVYRKRLEMLRERVVLAAKNRFGKDVVIKNLCELDDDDGQTGSSVVVIGTLFKHQPLKPNILKEISEDNDLAVEPILDRQTKFISQEDEIMLEDELQRIKLLPSQESEGRFAMSKLTTGIVCGVYGKIGCKKESSNDSGKFFVDDVVFPETPISPEPSNLDAERLLVILSGLDLCGGLRVNSGGTSHLPSLELATSWLTGEGGEMLDQERMSRVERVIVAGNCLAAETRDRQSSKARYLTKNKEATSIEGINALDDFLVQLATSLHVDLMPGSNDPANQCLPQQPLHKCLFPQAGAYPTFQSVTNPYCCKLADGRVVLGCSGQNVEDIMRNTDLEDPLDVLECILKWGHLAPTCPDTLGCFPYNDQDPFIFSQIPHIFFVANQEKFSYRRIHNEQTILLSVPAFSRTRQMCVIDLRSMSCEVLEFMSQS